ncbi:hypothetical protein THASP1DRAFT_27236 [Thamnocephalis sphaerospora]|uniref:FMR1-interacting protein 1 conserved domain-containing protein n=1 Tax=Thamnocephalis sphaerospora TaxID=78915 RepID=A0A4P9XZ38_9FUNG|nr:hypothetical protein THASP1DRAFT_27236 [Thamnocephalis sphaerospora]|eukprot:RKP10991.1 hypothetical protein THASP1DRAFT_27236 [Thamnocephalis sphaerospora]
MYANSTDRPSRGGGRSRGRGRGRNRGGRGSRGRSGGSRRESVNDMYQPTVPRLDTPEAVAQWVAERKRKFPRGPAPSSSLGLLDAYASASSDEEVAAADMPRHQKIQTAVQDTKPKGLLPTIFAAEIAQERFAILQCLQYIAQKHYLNTF